ncbi:hypothetical protein FVEG_14767 [Fusarium verticillioides 7600]|uniref:Uncharacterized protein n=1 Tax=Gibberella moniliformis (strain M3125 / FGSC 7600) TaxID=334819 RepID=W7LDC5_GIBM7|nr:hypothetical protein FVEG_14767 [Fusarium verticillioides 7600]EWG37443.1 hypothetical protein FVEG_14767 [Fusarium verticillioides 7600]
MSPGEHDGCIRTAGYSGIKPSSSKILAHIRISGGRVSMSESSLSQIDCKAPVPSNAPSFKLSTRSENITDQYELDPSHNINLRMRLQLKTCSGVYRRHLADVLVGPMPMVSWCCKRATPFQQCWKEGSC